MQIQRATLANCHQADDCVVAIDVLRAFTTTAYLFAAGVPEIVLVSGVQEAFDLRQRLPDALLLGEVDGIRVPGFDLGNSPTDLLDIDLRGRRVIQRTTAGTQGVVRSAQAKTILTAALTNVSATVRYIQQLAPQTVTLVETGRLEGGWGGEDVACADALEAALIGRPVDWEEITRRARSSRSASFYDGTRPDFPANDLHLATQVDRFGFAMLVERRDGLHWLRAVQTG